MLIIDYFNFCAVHSCYFSWNCNNKTKKIKPIMKKMQAQKFKLGLFLPLSKASFTVPLILFFVSMLQERSRNLLKEEDFFGEFVGGWSGMCAFIHSTSTSYSDSSIFVWSSLFCRFLGLPLMYFCKMFWSTNALIFFIRRSRHIHSQHFLQECQDHLILQWTKEHWRKL